MVLASALPAAARTVTDSAGRVVEVPETVKRVFAAGPPTSTLLYVVAPETMVGWVRKPSAAEKPFLLPATRELPELGRLTGRGNTLSLERLLAEKPELIVDFGTINDTYRSLAVTVVIACAIGPYPIAPGEIVLALANRLIGPSRNATIEHILFDIRLPRVLAALLVGAALSAAGAAYQSLFRNPLVSPDILGVSTGAGLGAVLGILLGLPVFGI